MRYVVWVCRDADRQHSLFVLALVVDELASVPGVSADSVPPCASPVPTPRRVIVSGFVQACVNRSDAQDKANALRMSSGDILNDHESMSTEILGSKAVSEAKQNGLSSAIEDLQQVTTV